MARRPFLGLARPLPKFSREEALRVEMCLSLVDVTDDSLHAGHAVQLTREGMADDPLMGLAVLSRVAKSW